MLLHSSVTPLGQIPHLAGSKYVSFVNFKIMDYNSVNSTLLVVSEP